MTPAEDAWIAGDAYEPFIGRWSRLVAREFLAWLAAPPNICWLDIGCGTGALTAAILADTAPALVCGVDASPSYVAHARNVLSDRRAAFAAADARWLPLRSASADVIVSGLVLNFVPDAGLAVAELARVVRAGGTVAVYVWDYAGDMQMLRRFWDAAASQDDRARALDEGERFPLCHPRALEALFEAAGLRQVESRAIDVPTHFRDFEDYWTPFLGGQGPAPGYVASLSESRRVQLRERLRSELPPGSDGSIELQARAWAVRGMRN
ncbi:MAG TPA: methyltransferase domain-containing protein [Bryobacteraceae bacterium]|nr:methyltransferase domain-containing protein [Bryobacteraceae bacterium]